MSNVLIVTKQETENVARLGSALGKKKLFPSIVELSEIGMLARGGRTSVTAKGVDLSDFDACFMDAPIELAPFVEVLLDEFAEKGVFCQAAPESYYVSSNKPFLLSSLSECGVRTPLFEVLPDASALSHSSGFKFPLVLHRYRGYQEAKRIVVEDESALKALCKSFSESDVVVLQELIESDLDRSLVVGDEVFNIRKKWSPKKRENVGRGVYHKLSNDAEETVFKACKTIGCSIALVDSSDGMVLEASPYFDVGEFSTSGKDVFSLIAGFYAEALK